MAPSHNPVVNIHEAKTHLSRLLARVQGGEEIVIGKAGKPIARIVPFTAKAAPRKPGFWKGKIKILKGFDDPLPPEVLKAFYGDDA
ncbi:MAG: type II toxin-antitoxin system Phd/YefM family antitoxin [Rhodospirillaceae bacterium]|nr:type II toxin-antitoxin system Phd/YefM family antitoxin [Rhodospirillaceae bacterium]